MTTVTYEDLYRQTATAIAAERDAALGLLGPSAPAVRAVVAELLRHRTFKYPLSVLPLIVHAAETGAPEPALPLAVAHELWWTSACCLDDLADSQGTYRAGDLDENAALLATVVAGTPLPLLVVQSERIPEPVRGTLSAEIVRCWILATEGQLRDLQGRAAAATCASVVTAYLGKSGAPFGMVTAMAAELAGARQPRVELWREFGTVFGVLWQLFNDQEDILSGRGEDLRNGIVTYLLACALEEAATAGSTERVLALHAAARHSARARADLTDLLLAPAVLCRFEKAVGEFRARAHGILDELGGDGDYLTTLRDLVDRSSPMLLEPRI
ncbi:polyprenyl synthetase family protein [Streptomyces musisoli]|uniref:polyprenyl synthetase family protein n=1 Tax=Streptomyces musisoli TaxID=2802280 RepID=UPI0027D9FEEF|nr:polyprenyl synthetase family protein [Streptomyces musisoli]